MKYLQLFLLTPLLFFSAMRVSAQQQIKATVTGFKNEKGVCRACLYDNAAAFSGKGDPVQCVEATIKNKSAVIIFNHVKKGSYAINLFHDANNNQKFDVNFLGIPKVGYGASGNKLPFAAAPTFSDNKFEVNNSAVLLAIKLRYL
jgi:uncharacterized protein (DUF2141 family)